MTSDRKGWTATTRGQWRPTLRQTTILTGWLLLFNLPNDFHGLLIFLWIKISCCSNLKSLIVLISSIDNGTWFSSKGWFLWSRSIQIENWSLHVHRLVLVQVWVVLSFGTIKRKFNMDSHYRVGIYIYIYVYMFGLHLMKSQEPVCKNSCEMTTEINQEVRKIKTTNQRRRIGKRL